MPVVALVIFDLDNTLIHGYMDDDPSERDFHRVELLPRRRAVIRALKLAGCQVGIATNQGGVAFGYNTENDVIRKVAKVIRELGIDPKLVRCCFHHPGATIEKYADPIKCQRRKPSGAMLKEVIDAAGTEYFLTMYVGDRPEDRAAAEDAGTYFQLASDFFDDPGQSLHGDPEGASG